MYMGELWRIQKSIWEQIHLEKIVHQSILCSINFCFFLRGLIIDGKQNEKGQM